MRGSDERAGSVFSYVDLEARVRGDHRWGAIREIVNAALSDLSKAFSALYTDFVHDLRDRSVTPHIAVDGHLGKNLQAAQDGG